MNRQQLLSYFAKFAIVGCLASTQGAIAAPASVFEPLVNDIRSQLSAGLEVRLPAIMPPSPIRLYPFINQAESDRFVISLATNPNCAMSAKRSSCTVGGIAVFSPKASKFPPQGDNLDTIVLSNNIKGYSFTRGKGENAARYVSWEQNGLRYSIGAVTSATSQTQLIELANSMIVEPPITVNRR